MNEMRKVEREKIVRELRAVFLKRCVLGSDHGGGTNRWVKEEIEVYEYVSLDVEKVP